jgi:hypothetical protein
MFPVSHFPTSLVEVWAILELLFHVIVEFFAIVMAVGLNEFPAIVIVLFDGVLDDGAVGLEELSLHPIINTNSILVIMTENPTIACA